MRKDIETIKVFVTKAVFTKGIEEVEVRKTSTPDLVVTLEKWERYFHKGDWFLTRDEAVIKAEQMKERKIKSLEKQLNKIKKLNF